MGSLLEITGVNGRLWHIEAEDVAWWHGGPIHILHASKEIYSTINELRSLFNILSQALCIGRGVIVTLNRVDIFTKVANPLLTLLYEFHKGIDVSTTIFAPNDRLIVEIGTWDWLSWRQFAERLNYDGQRDRCFFGLLSSGWDAISRHSQQWFVRVEIIHRFAFEGRYVVGLGLRDIRSPLGLLKWSHNFRRLTTIGCPTCLVYWAGYYCPVIALPASCLYKFWVGC